MDTTVKLDLTETGTRYDHYMELRDAFATGVEIMKHALEVHKSVTDLQRMEKLQNSVDLINSRVNYLAEFDKLTTTYSDLAKTIRAIPTARPAQLPEVSESTRAVCEREMKEAAAHGYEVKDEEDGGTKNSPND